ncbi:hypothetical protein CXF29_10850 [Corynebacterium bovis]|nr:hypothetical protein CXF29_10850 [Corynebacterium bovis]RRQ14674.1 hypothetical protein CXF47_02705 [Corynebacterium bovis]
MRARWSVHAGVPARGWGEGRTGAPSDTPAGGRGAGRGAGRGGQRSMFRGPYNRSPASPSPGTM